MRTLKLFAACAVLVLVPSQLLAQSYADTVWAQLQSWYEDYNDDGYSVRNYIVGKLDEGESDSWTFPLYSGNDYRIVGACDEDCGDIDLSIYDQDGRLVDEDTLDDDYPIVDASVRKDGNYTIEIDMYECDVEPCYFGIAIFYD